METVSRRSFSASVLSLGLSGLLPTAADARSLPLPASARPGDNIYIPRGNYTNPITINYNGKSNNPIRIVAQNLGKSRIKNRVLISGNNCILEGFDFTNGYVEITGSGNEIHNCQFRDGVAQFQKANAITIRSGARNKVTRCRFLNWFGSGVSVRGATKNTEITGCLFRKTKSGRLNGTEAIQLGVGKNDNLKKLKAVVSYNRFERWNSDDEIITVKSSNNHLLLNTFLNCDGRVQNRHGRNNVYEGLFMTRCWSLRIHDAGNKVFGCVLRKSIRDGLEIGAGTVQPGKIVLPNGSTGHPYADRTTVAGCDTDKCVIGDAYPAWERDGLNILPDRRTVLRQHRGNITTSYTSSASNIRGDRNYNKSFTKARVIDIKEVGVYWS